MLYVSHKLNDEKYVKTTTVEVIMIKCKKKNGVQK